MTKKSSCLWILLALALVVSSGCVSNRQVDRRSPSEVLLDVVAGFFEESDFERYDRINGEAFEKRRKWQCENLSQTELSELGIAK